MVIPEVLATTADITKKVVESTEQVIDKIAKSTEKVAKATEFVADNISETLNSPFETSAERSFLYSKLEEVKQLTPEQLEAKMSENLNEQKSLDPDYEHLKAKDGLTDEEKARLKEETGWSDEVLNNIGSMEEAEIYKNAELVEVKIGDKSCLIRRDIDWTEKDQFGRSNAERAKQGLAPIDSNGKPLELHHIGQHNDSPLAELNVQEHRGKGNDTILHDKSKESEIDRSAFGSERAEHWQERVITEGVNLHE